MDDSPSAIEPSGVKATGAEGFARAAPDRQVPLSWLLPWLLALVGILMTLVLSR